MHDALQNFKQLYRQLSRDTLTRELLLTTYRTDIQFTDPLHSITGIDALHDYFRELYSNISACEFEFHEEFFAANTAVIFWTMHYRHPRLRGGKTITVSGNSQLRFDTNGIYWQRDFVDMGAMLYEHIPLLGNLIRLIKRRVQ